MQSNKNVNILLGILAVVVLIFVFVYTRNNGSQTVTSGLVAEKTDNSNEISQFLRRISSIKDVRLDISVFNNPVLKNGLKDNSQELVPEEKGRLNPFESISPSRISSSVSGGISNSAVAPVVTASKKVLSD